MKKEEEDFMAHLLVDSLLAFTILLAQKRVCSIEFLIIIILPPSRKGFNSSFIPCQTF